MVEILGAGMIVIGTILIDILAIVVVVAFIKEAEDKYLTLWQALGRTFMVLAVIAAACVVSFYNLTHIPDVLLSSYNHTIVLKVT